MVKPGKLLSARLKQLREDAGLSQQELANKAGLSVSQVAKLEQGSKADPRISTILALAAALDLTPGQILDNLPVPPAKEKKKDRKDRKEKKEKPKKEKAKEKKPESKPVKKAKAVVRDLVVAEKNSRH